MHDFSDALGIAAALVAAMDPEVLQVVGLSLRVSFSAVLISALFGLPLGALLALARFPGRGALIVTVNAAMGLPPVVVGLVVYLGLSRAGPLGALGLLFTPTAMIVAQAILVLPIIAGLSRQTVQDLWEEYAPLLHSFGVGLLRAVPTLLWEGRYRLITVMLAGFGRAIAEVGAVIIVGGNIAGITRTMTTTIALQTARGNLPLALALGGILIVLTVLVNAAAQAVGLLARRANG